MSDPERADVREPLEPAADHGVETVTARFVVPMGYAPRAARTMMSYMMAPRRGWLWYVIAACGVAAVLLGLAGWPEAAIGFWVGVGILWLVVVMPLLILRNTIRQARAHLPAGLVLEAEFGPEEFTVREPSSTVTATYANFRSLEAWRDMVVLNALPRRSPSQFFFPGALFPGEVRDRFQSVGRTA